MSCWSRELRARSCASERVVVGTVEHDRIDKPSDRHLQPRVDNAVTTHRATRLPTSRETPPTGPRDAVVVKTTVDAEECRGDQHEKRQCPLEEEVGQRKRIVLIQNREGERDGRVVAE